jgi:hypothetical protein
MPCYFFNLKTAHDVIRDPEGTELPDERCAQAHARNVARELMANRKADSTRLWRLRVCDARGESIFELLLASFHPAVSHLPPDLRESLEDVCRKTAALNDTINQVRTSLYQVRGTIARSERAPYVAALDGVRL